MTHDASSIATSVSPPHPAGTPLAQRIALALARLSPIVLGLVQAAIALGFTLLMLHPPPRQPGFQGVVNNVNSPRAYRRLTLWFDHLDALGDRLPHISLEPAVFMWSMRAAVIALALVHILALAAALVRLRTGASGPVWPWLVGPSLTMAVFLIYPPLCSDVFYYITSGAIANAGGNPYEHPLRVYFAAPLLPYNDWAHIASPYGPVWTGFCRLVVAVWGATPVSAITGFRLLAIIASFILAALIWRLALRLTGRRELALVALVATLWLPVLSFEAATGAHNDALMFSLAFAGLAVMQGRRRGATRLGLLLIALSTLLKYVTLPLLIFAALWRLADFTPGRSSRRLLFDWTLDVAMIVTAAVIAIAPYWVGAATFHSLAAQPARGVSATMWVIPHAAIVGLFGNDVARRFDDFVGFATILLLLPIFGATFLWLAWRMWTFHGESGLVSSGPTRDRRLLVMLQAWLVPCMLLPFFPVDTHNWYAIWSIGPLALFLVWWLGSRATPPSSEDRLPRWLERLGPARVAAVYLGFSLLNFLVYHTRWIP